MGWGDRFESHHYVGISADRIMGALKERYPGLRSPATNAQRLSGLASAVNALDSDSINECSHTIMMVEGEITLKDQLHEYMYRGEELIEMSLFSFMLDTYDAKAEHIGQVGTLHCTGRSDSRNAYSVADDPSSRGPVNPRISFYINKFFIRIHYTLRSSIPNG